MIHGLLHGIRRCLLRVMQGFAACRRPGARRKRGGFMGRAGIDLFIEDGAYTTLSSAVVILVVLTLLFSSTAAIWSMSRAGDTQVAAGGGCEHFEFGPGGVCHDRHRLGRHPHSGRRGCRQRYHRHGDPDH